MTKEEFNNLTIEEQKRITKTFRVGNGTAFPRGVFFSSKQNTEERTDRYPLVNRKSFKNSDKNV